MNILDVIAKKRDKGILSKEEIEYFVNEYVDGNIEDYQASAMLMAMYINGLNMQEIVDLTLAMASSSNVLDFEGIFRNSYILDKHSTGGVGDKVTIIAIPIAASLGVKVFKMSGRGLGFTGGTADKLESIEGYKTEQDLVGSLRILNENGACMVTQSSEIAIADKKLYALRDVTATVNSIPLIAASIMSKKIASGVDKIVLEVTAGDGAFCKTEEEAKKLSEIMVSIGKMVGKETVAVITNMDQPLGLKVGNSLEIEEVIEFLLADREILESEKYKDLKDVVFEIVAYMLKLAGLADSIREAKLRIMENILNHKAYEKFIDIVKAQGGHITTIYMEHLGKNVDVPVLSYKASFMKEIKADKDGYVNYVDTEKVGKALVELGGGRHKKDDNIDLSVGFELKKKNGDKVNKGDTIMQVLFNDREKFDMAARYLSEAIKVEEYNVINKPHILDVITGDEN